MVKNHKLVRIILEQKWDTFVRMLEYKTERASGQVMKGNPANTSRTCSSCGIEIDRDDNAARNFLRLAQATSSAGVSAEEFGSEVKQIDGVELWQGIVERTQNSIVYDKSHI